jgi:predicted RNA-binding protein with PUA-like domain
MAINYWLLKTEPETFSFDDLVKKKVEHWDGVRNYQARNNLSSMQPKDLCLIYHSVSEKSVVGIAEVVSHAYPDPTTEDKRWVCVDIKAIKKLKNPITLEVIKNTQELMHLPLVKHSRLSVMPIDSASFEIICKMGL